MTDLADVLASPIDEMRRQMATFDSIEGSLDELARRLAALRAVEALAKTLAAPIENDLAARMETDEMVIPNVGKLTRFRDKRTAWRFKHSGDDLRHDLGQAIAAEISTDVATGEIDEMKRNVAHATLRATWDVIPSFSNVLVAAKRRFGIEIDDYRETAWVDRVRVDMGVDE